MVVKPVICVEVEEVNELDGTSRGIGGFESTGTSTLENKTSEIYMCYE